MADTPSWLRPAFGPAVPEDIRRQLVGDTDAGALPLLLTGLVSIVFGIAGTAVLVSGAHPRDADPVVFQAVAGGGLLLVALATLVLCVRSTARQKSARRDREQWRDQVISQSELATIVAAAPAIGELLSAATAATDEIRASTAYAEGWLESAFPEDTIRISEWSVAVHARHAYRTGTIPVAFSGQVDRLRKVRDGVRRLDRAIEERRTNDLLARTLTDRTADGGTDCDGALAAISDLSQLIRGYPESR
jgi:hypothetical protein